MCQWRSNICFVMAIAAIAHVAWAPPGRRPGTTVQLPTFGVSIDVDGLLSVRVNTDPTGQLAAQRRAAAVQGLPANVVAPATLRKVSLVRLDLALSALQDNGQPATDAMRHLAGLQRVRFIFCDPESGEIIIAGPAEGWMPDAAGRSVGLQSGQPVLLLEDLAVALRAFPPGGKARPMIGCTIEPTADGLRRLVEFQRTIPRTIRDEQRTAIGRQIYQGLRESLGMAGIRTFGVLPRTHLAKVMIEADYRMKLKAIGLEPMPIPLKTYLELTRSAKQGTLQRWWFTPDYQCLRASEDRLAVEIVGQGVQLQTENKRIGTQGALHQAGQADPAAERFAQGFTAKYPELAGVRPVYAQLRDVVDLLMAAAWLQRNDYYGRTGWQAELLRDETRLPTETFHAPKQVPAAVNCVWRGRRLLAPAGGGVEIFPHRGLESDNLLDDDQGDVTAARNNVALPRDALRWWWD